MNPLFWTPFLVSIGSTTRAKTSGLLPRDVPLLELFLSVLVAGISALNSAIPFAVWRRTGDARFVFLSLANALLSVLGLVWVWGQLPVNPPSFTSVSDSTLALVLLAVLLFLVATLGRRRA